MDNKKERYPYEDNVAKTLKEIKKYIDGIKSERVCLAEGDVINTKENFMKLIISKLESAKYLNEIYGYDTNVIAKEICRIKEKLNYEEFDHFLSEIESLIEEFG